MFPRIAFAAVGVLVLASACAIRVAPTASPLPSPFVANATTLTTTPAAATIAPTHASSPAARTTTTPAATSSSRAGVPAWWPRDLSMPAGVEYLGESDGDKAIPYRIAHWVTKENDLDALCDRLIQLGQNAGYTVTVSPKTKGEARYTVWFLKSTQAFVLHLLGGLPPTTRVDGGALPTIQFKTTGAIAQAMVLPAYDWGIQSDVSMRLATPGTKLPTPAVPVLSLHLAASVLNGQCNDCRYAISLTVPAFKGPGTYSAADVQANPGGNGTTGDYRNPTNCTFIVKDEFNGTFECQGLKTSVDPTQTIDLSGSWQAPAP